ncbi:TOMM precursor leader peptide-binding protein [Georgenia wangjunii]|uniref:TOMM precursor leader peptide-binding protein n=1 Tax=Georgenia wangjunii TaxID=3117730 RepID=UPI002F25F708
MLRLAPDLEVVHVDGGLLLVTSVARLRLEGGVAGVVRDRLLAPLEAGAARAELLAAVPAEVSDEVGAVLDSLLRAGVVVEEPDGGERQHPSWTYLVAGELDDRAALAARAAAVRVAVVGARDVGAVLAESLAEAGIGTIYLVDPYRAQPGDPLTRELEVAGRLAPRYPSTRFTPGEVALDRESVDEIVSRSDLVVTAVDPELSAVRHWVNAASLAHDVPSLHAALLGTRAQLGPLVMPGEGPCYLCWRMRALACEDDFPAAMAREEVLDAVRRPAARPRPVLPPLVPWAAGALAREVLAATLGILPPRLPAHVLVLDAASGREEVHPVLARPDCAACRKKARPPSPGLPDLVELAGAPTRTTDFDAIAARVVSPLAGLVRQLERIPKDVEEPEEPVVVRAQLANARFLAGEHGFVGCSGKARSARAARDGALGEALERYAALTWGPPRTVRSTRGQLDGPSLDPRDLVLFTEDQYATLPYAPYSRATELDWVPARSLVSGEEVWVPLLATHLGYDVPERGAYLFPATSNGFAGGATLTDAVLGGLLEVVERDAFLIAWAHRLAGVRSPAATVPDEDVRRIADAYARRRVEIDVHRLPTDTAATVVLAIGWSEETPAVVLGLGADLDPVRAARGAVLEVGQVRPALRARIRRPETAARLAELVADPWLVSDLEDHDLLYADPGTASAGLGYLRAAPARPWTEPAGGGPGTGEEEPAAPAAPGARLRALVASLARVAGDVLYVDVTPDDVRGLGVRVARGIVPGFQPIHFGARENRLGGERLARMPVELGLVAAVPALTDLNLAPHPLA